MPKCRSCGAVIKWINTTAGKNMPCDTGIIPYWNPGKGKDVLVLDDGRTIHCTLDPQGRDADGIGFRPHWATCQNANMHRRKK